MTNNAWNTPTLQSAGDGKILIGSGSGRPLAANITGDSVVSITNGTNSISVASSVTANNWKKLATATASSSASIDFTGLSSTYFLYILEINDLQPATDATTLLLRTSTNNGSSYDSGASDYQWIMFEGDDVGGATAYKSTGDTSITVCGKAGGTLEMGNATNEKGSGTIYIFNPSASKWTFIISKINYLCETGKMAFGYISGIRMTTTAVDAFQVLMDSGNIASGDFVLYGATNT